MWQLQFKSLKDLLLADKVNKLIGSFHKTIERLSDGSGILPEITSDNELSYRLWKNIGNIKSYNGNLGYVVLQDNTIICVASSSWISQFDGCDENEIRHS